MKQTIYNLLRAFFMFSTIIAAIWIPLPLYLQIILTVLMCVAVYMLFDLMQQGDKDRKIVKDFAKAQLIIVMKEAFGPEEKKEDSNGN